MTAPRTPLDDYARHCIADTPNVIVSWWLMASWLYYCRDVSLLTDHYYDELCSDLDARWDTIEHPHKHLVDRAALSAGSGFTLTEDAYPLRVKGAAEYILSAGPPRMPCAVNELEAPGARRPAPKLKTKPQGELFG